MDRMRKIAQRPPEPPIVPPRLPPPQPKTAPLPPEGARQARRQFFATIETIKGVLEHILQSKDDRWLKRLGGGRRERGWKAIAMMVDDLNTTRRTVAAYPEKDELKAAAYLLGENERLWNRYKRLFGDHPLWPAQEARMRRRRGEMERGLVALAEALEALGDGNSAALARVLAAPQLAGEAQGWADRFFRANPEFMDRAERFAEAKGIDLAQYLNQLDSMREDMGRRMIHRDLGYVGMPWSPAGKPSRKPLRPEAELRWPFPPPNVLQDERAFIAAALAWAMGGGLGAYERMYGSAAGLRDTGRRGEIQAARAYLRHLMKDVAPQLAATLQAKWREASAGGDAEAQRALRVWWGTLSDVWELLQDMVGSINAYERGD